MTTKVTFDDPSTKVKLSSLKVGSAFEYFDKLYIKLPNDYAVRVKGDNLSEDFGLATFLSSEDTIVEPLDVEIKFSRQ